ncbi:MAG: hypothetical protein ACI9DC_000989 [Gammaproteobacteria bacterium]|jgi:hypothetical protein
MQLFEPHRSKQGAFTNAAKLLWQVRGHELQTLDGHMPGKLNQHSSEVTQQ